MILMTTGGFHALAQALVNLKPDWFADKVDVDAIKLVLAEVGDIWPASILDEVDGGGALPDQTPSETNRHKTPLDFGVDMLSVGGPDTNQGHP